MFIETSRSRLPDKTSVFIRVVDGDTMDKVAIDVTGVLTRKLSYSNNCFGIIAVDITSQTIIRRLEGSAKGIIPDGCIMMHNGCIKVKFPLRKGIPQYEVWKGDEISSIDTVPIGTPVKVKLYLHGIVHNPSMTSATLNCKSIEVLSDP
tara:strand:- start:360 stop:806 length:447 start_codon:yes stop_codon:yes gene_type:complete